MWEPTNMVRLIVTFCSFGNVPKKEKNFTFRIGRLSYSCKYCMEYPFNDASNVNIVFFELHKLTPLTPLKTRF